MQLDIPLRTLSRQVDELLNCTVYDVVDATYESVNDVDILDGHKNVRTRGANQLPKKFKFNSKPEITSPTIQFQKVTSHSPSPSMKMHSQVH